MKEIIEIKVTYKDSETDSLEVVTYKNLKNKCALIWGDVGVEYYLNSISNLSPDKIESRKHIIELIIDACKKRGITATFIKGNDCLPG